MTAYSWTTLAWMSLSASLLALVWAYVAYPALIMARARLWPRPVAKQVWSPSVTVCVAAHQAGAEVEAKVRHLLAHDYPIAKLDIIVVSDGSTDDTLARLRPLQGPRLQVIDGGRRRGKSACLADAIAAARGEVLVFTDVRQRLAPGSIAGLCAALADGGYRVVGGLLRFTDGEGYASTVDAYWRFETALRRAEALTGSVVGVSGALYAVRRADMPVPPAGLVLDDLWVPMRIAEAGGRIGLEPAAVALDEPSRSPAVEAARKRRTLAGNWQLILRHPRWLVPGLHPLALRFWQHKLLRLLGPVFLLLALLSSAVLALTSAVAQCLLVAQALAYGLALAGMLRPAWRRWLPVRLCATFLEMNVYAVLGAFDYLGRRDVHLWSVPVPVVARTP